MVNKQILRELLVSSYSKDELFTLATDITGNAELVFSDNGTLETQARELVAWCGRRNKMQVLVDQIKKDRPDAYKANEKQLDEADSPSSEVQSASEEIEEAFEVLKPVEINKETTSDGVSSNNKLRVFLCHSSQDKPIVRKIYQRLIAESWIDPWLDEEKLLPGMDWNLEIEKAVDKADAVLVFLSKNSVTKEGYVQRELLYALDIALEKPEGTIFIIPVRLEECQPPRRLHTWQYVDIFPSEQRDRAIQKIIGSLRIRAKDLKSEPNALEN